MKTIRVEMDEELYRRVVQDQQHGETRSEAVCRILWDGVRGDPEAVSLIERAFNSDINWNRESGTLWKAMRCFLRHRLNLGRWDRIDNARGAR